MFLQIQGNSSFLKQCFFSFQMGIVRKQLTQLLMRVTSEEIERCVHEVHSVFPGLKGILVTRARDRYFTEKIDSLILYIYSVLVILVKEDHKGFLNPHSRHEKNVLGIKWMVSFLFSCVLLKMLAPEEYSFKIVFGLPTWHCDSVEHRRWVVIVKFVTFSYDTLALSFSLNKNLKTVTVWCHNSYRIIFEEKKKHNKIYSLNDVFIQNVISLIRVVWITFIKNYGTRWK